MKLLCDSKAVKGLQELINRCAGTTPGEARIVQNIRKHKTVMGREIRLTAQIGEHEMDQVILDFSHGSYGTTLNIHVQKKNQSLGY